MENVDAERNSTQISDPSLARGGGSSVTRSSSEGNAEKTEKKTSTRDTLRSNLDKGTKREAKEESDVGTSLEKSKKPSTRESLQAGIAKPTEKPAITTSTVAAPAEQERELIAAPADMSAEERESFSKLDPASQKYISRRALELRQDYTRKTMELGQQRGPIKDVIDAITPLSKEYSNVGLGKLITNTTAWDRALKSESKHAAAREFLAEYGINIEELGAPAEGEEQAQPQGNYLTREEAEALADERVQKYFTTEQQKGIAQQNLSVVQEFMRSKPLFKDPGTAEQLEQDISPVAASLRHSYPQKSPQEILNLAYDYVTKGNPTYSALLSQLSAKSEAQTTNEVAEKAQRASRSISGGPGSGTPKVKHKNMRENLRANFRK